MKKLIAAILLLAVLLSSCNFPLANPTPDLNLVSTKVAGTLAAVQTQNLPTNLPEEATLTPEIATPTLTTEPTETQTATATITPPAGDPASSLGEPGFFETFSSSTSFGLSDPYVDDAVQIQVENGAMVFKSLRSKSGIRWRLTSRNPQNLYLEGKFTTINCLGSDQYGLIVRAPSYSDGIGYYFGVTCDGQYYLLRWDSENQNSIVNLTPDSKILAGSNQSNRLGILLNGKSIRLYLNGQLVREIEDEGISAKGYIGAFVSAREDPTFTVQLEELKLWTLP